MLRLPPRQIEWPCPPSPAPGVCPTAGCSLLAAQRFVDRGSRSGALFSVQVRNREAPDDVGPRFIVRIAFELMKPSVKDVEDEAGSMLEPVKLRNHVGKVQFPEPRSGRSFSR